MKKTCLIFCAAFVCIMLRAQQTEIISAEDFRFLEELTRDVVESSRIYPGQKLPDPFGENNTGGVLVRPGGRDTYPAFWIRDYAMSLGTDFITADEQRHMLLLTAATQCDQTWLTRDGTCMIPQGAIADHIRVETSLPIYYPGTYDYEIQGNNEYQYGLFPPYSDQFFFVSMARHYVEAASDTEILRAKVNGTPLIDRLEMAFRVPPVRAGSQLVCTEEAFLGVDFGFRDAVKITGELVFPSLMKYRAAHDMAWLFERLGDREKSAEYAETAARLKKEIVAVFINRDGMLRASTGMSGQPDVWSTALAVCFGVLEGEDMKKACSHLAKAYADDRLAYKGNIRHIIKGEDYDATTAWEVSVAGLNTYQNGSYWGTPTGWVAYAISKSDPAAASRLVKEFIDDLRENDYRKGPQYGAPFECLYPPDYLRGPVYMTTVACPYMVFKKIKGL